MELTINAQGQVFNAAGEELTVLTDREQDYLIKTYVKNGVKTIAEESRYRTSYGGSHAFDMDWFTHTAGITEPEDNCPVSSKIYEIGGTRLLTLYCNHFNFFSAALDLGISYAALMKWFQRLRSKLREDGVKPEDFGLQMSTLKTVYICDDKNEQISNS